MRRIIRVFPRKTSFNPVDEMAFVGSPPSARPEADEVHISVSFTWDIARAEQLASEWQAYYPVVKLGGPAIDGEGDEFTPGVYVKQGVTFTSRGCPNNCSFCLVNGSLRLLEIKPGHIIQDNNILATGKQHMSQVFEMLRRQKNRASFSGGLQSSLVDDWVADQFRTLRIEQVFLAADTPASLEPLRYAVDKLAFLGRNKLRCYVMIGRESMEQAEHRLKQVWNIGCLPFAQLYQPPERIEYSKDWKDLARAWSRPAITRSIMRNMV